MGKAQRFEERPERAGPETGPAAGGDPSLRLMPTEPSRRTVRQRIIDHLDAGFARDHVSCWANLSRSNISKSPGVGAE